MADIQAQKVFEETLKDNFELKETQKQLKDNQQTLEKYIDEPLLITRDEKGSLHCLSNVCTHRGNLLVYESCKLTNLRCRYHGRLFHLDGQFKSMPEFKEVKDFPSADDNLTGLPLFQWGKLLFTSLHPRYAPEVFFNDMMAVVFFTAPDARGLFDFSGCFLSFLISR